MKSVMTNLNAEIEFSELRKLGIAAEQLVEIFEGAFDLTTENRAKLQSLLVVFTYLTQWSRNNEEAWSWFCKEQIPALNMTAKEAFQRGLCTELEDYIISISIGGFA
ncbi:MAG: hypothetical protein ACI88H_000474 [Cocleimonas sp.]|jgi:hypothetical protein